MDVAVSWLPLLRLRIWPLPQAKVSQNGGNVAPATGTGTGTVLPKQASGQQLWILSWQSSPRCDRIYVLQKLREWYNTLLLSFTALRDPAGRCDTKWPSLGGLQDQEPN